MILDANRRPILMQIWNGHVRETELVVLDPAVAIQSFWAPKEAQARLAVAAGPHVYIYIGVTVHYKVSLPKEHVQAEDEAVWCAAPQILVLQPAPLHTRFVRSITHDYGGVLYESERKHTRTAAIR